MLKAEHEKLAHEASISLVEIRNIELQYYLTFFNTVAVQFTFIAGYQMTTYYNTQALTGTSFGSEIQSAFQTCYWFFTVISVFLAIEGVCVSVYTVVFGYALALRGPAGSMIRAINGFEREQRLVLIVFSLSIFFLGIGTIFQMYVVMDWLSAHLCASVAVVLMYHWYTHCVDVYNRYNFRKETVDWTRRDDYRRSAVMSDDLGSGPNFDNNPLHAAERERVLNKVRREPSMGFITIMSDKELEGRAQATAAEQAAYAAQEADASGERQSFFQYFFTKRDSGRRSDMVDPNAGLYFGDGALAESESITEPLMRESGAQAATRYADENFDDIYYDGEVEFRGGAGGNRDRDARWETRYVLVRDSGVMSFYTSMEAYRTSGEKSECKKFVALNLGQYCFRMVPGNGDGNSGRERDVVLLTLVSAMRASTVAKTHTIEMRCKSRDERANRSETQKFIAAVGLYSLPASSFAMMQV